MSTPDVNRHSHTSLSDYEISRATFEIIMISYFERQSYSVSDLPDIADISHPLSFPLDTFYCNTNLILSIHTLTGKNPNAIRGEIFIFAISLSF